MDSIVNKLLESRRIDEVKKKVALDSIVSSLRDKLSSIEGYSHHKLSIEANYDEGCVDVYFKDTNDSFRVYPQKSRISNENSNKIEKVENISGAYIEGTLVYDSEGNLLGDALIRRKATHSKSDYSEDLDLAEYRFNSKIADLKKLEKYIASEAINNTK